MVISFFKKIFLLFALIIFNTSLSLTQNISWDKIVAGQYHCIGLKTDNTLWFWGTLQNYSGKNQSSFPIRIGKDKDWSFISTKAASCAALKKNGTLWTWGANICGQIGDGSKEFRPSPIKVGNDSTWIYISTGWLNTYGIKSDGSLWGWGDNRMGQLCIKQYKEVLQPIQIGCDTTWTIVSGGLFFVAGIKNDSTLWTWGENSNGELGILDKDSFSFIPKQIGINQKWTQVAAGHNHSLAISADSSLWSWGAQWWGALGDNYRGVGSYPVKIGDDKWIKIASGDASSIGLKSDSTLWEWGRINNGEYGNSQTKSYLPIKIGEFKKWSHISAGRGFIIAIDNQKNTFCGAGFNEYGNLGNGTTIHEKTLTCNEGKLKKRVKKKPAS